MRCFETSISMVLLCINVYIPCMCTRFPSISTMMVKASPIQGRTHALRTASLCHATSICSFSALACCVLASHWVRTTVCAVPRTLSYFCWSSHDSVSKCWMLGSSYRVVRTSSDSCNMLVHSLTAPPISSNLAMIALVHCFLTSRGVDGCTFNRSWAI